MIKMELKNSIQNRRLGIIINFKSLIALVLLFEFIRLGILPRYSLIFEIIPFLVLITSYIIYFGKTGLWKFTHKPVNQLDEREIQLSNQSLRFSYLIFTIFVLSLFIIY